MKLLENLRMKVIGFMRNRNGADELSFAMLFVALILMIVSSFTNTLVLNIIALCLYGLLLFRMFSRNVTRRRLENQKFREGWAKAKLSVSQGWVRLRNFRKYKYFHCPECKAMLRLPRKVGEVTVTCGKCHHAFKKKA